MPIYPQPTASPKHIVKKKVKEFCPMIEKKAWPEDSIHPMLCLLITSIVSNYTREKKLTFSIVSL